MGFWAFHQEKGAILTSRMPKSFKVQQAFAQGQSTICTASKHHSTMVNLLTPLDIQKVETFCIKKWVLGDSLL